MNRSLDELTASELNDAIDDTNFPKAQSTNCLSMASEEVKNGTHPLNGNEDKPTEASDEQTEPVNGQNGHKGFIKRAHPAPLKMVAFKGDSFDVPGTPRTPRTSTTPGNIGLFYFLLRNSMITRWMRPNR